MLKNMQNGGTKSKISRKIMFTIIIIICAISIILAVVYEVQKTEIPTEIPQQGNKEITDLKTIFNNQLNKQNYTIQTLSKINEEKEIVYTKYEGSEKVNEKYDVDIKIPTININNETIESVNKEIDSLFRQKALSIVKSNEEYEVIFTVEYTAYINSNILSLAIKSTLKEGKNAQRVIVKTYTYNMSTEELLDINKIITIKQLNKSVVQKDINNLISENAKQSQSLIDLGYKVYQRNLNDEMYKIDNVNNFFYGPEGVLYIIYAYGNNSYTSEMDVIPIE